MLVLKLSFNVQKSNFDEDLFNVMQQQFQYWILDKKNTGQNLGSLLTPVAKADSRLSNSTVWFTELKWYKSWVSISFICIRFIQVWTANINVRNIGFDKNHQFVVNRMTKCSYWLLIVYNLQYKSKSSATYITIQYIHKNELSKSLND